MATRTRKAIVSISAAISYLKKFCLVELKLVYIFCKTKELIVELLIALKIEATCMYYK